MLTERETRIADAAGWLAAGRRLLAAGYSLYRDGFRNMRTGRTLWKIIFLKLVLFLLILKLFFPDVLHTHFRSDRQRAAHVLDNLTMPVSSRMQGGK